MDVLIRLGCASAIFLLMAGWEILSPRRLLKAPKIFRWKINIGLAALNMAIMRVSLGSWAYLTAIWAKEHSIGLLNQITIPLFFSTVLTLLLLDFAIYSQHILSHKIALLWRLHQIHHTDIDVDVTTAVRFHPLEIMLSMVYKSLWITMIGANTTIVVLFEILLNLSVTFNHSNIYLPSKLDKIIRYIFVTPDMHRIHHSTNLEEMHSNYGFSIACWDRIFNTYHAEPQYPYTTMPIGLTGFRDMQQLGFFRLLLLPFHALKRR
jgi:sterol desaturase/sphingolipid hydroxylase (fatty acid hydroxylase superfamily)